MSNENIAQLKAAAAQAAAEAAEARAAAAQAALEAALAAQQSASDTAQSQAADNDATAVPAAQAALTEQAAPAQAESTAPALAESTTAAEPATASVIPADPASAPAAPADPVSAPAAPASRSAYAEQVAASYAFEGPRLTLGTFMEGSTSIPGVEVNLPLGMLNRHGLVAGATGTGKTRTLQLIAEGLSTAGVPVFITDIKGDLTGLLQAGSPSDKLTSRTQANGQAWAGTAFPVELFALGGNGTGVPIRTTVTDFGPLLLARVLGLNDTQESALSLIFAWADKQGLALIDLTDLRATVAYLTSDEGRDELEGIGGVSTATAGVILREISALEAQGATEFFGEPAFETAAFLRSAADGRGIISCLELPDVASQPALFSTFVMWLLASLFQDLPEVGDPEKPKLVFFFDEAHLLFNGASKEFLNQVVQTVRLIRSKGVGIVFVTQTPQDVPPAVLAQLGSRVQHALRAHTPNDQKALKATVATFPQSPLDLENVLPNLGTGEAIVTVLDTKGRPTPVAPVRLWAPASVMGPASAEAVNAVIAGSPFMATYKDPVDPESAFELLARRVADEAQAAAAAEAEEKARREAEAAAAAAEKQRLKELEAEAKEAKKAIERERREAEKAAEQAARREERDAERQQRRREAAIDSVVRSVGRSLGSAITRSLFGSRRR